MAQFLGDIAFLLALIVVASGLCLLYLANRQNGAGLLRVAGYVLVIGGIGTALCTGYYWLQYQSQGQFETAYPAVTRGMMSDEMSQMHKHMMQRMDKHKRNGDMPRQQGPHDMPGAGEQQRHEEHHPQ